MTEEEKIQEEWQKGYEAFLAKYPDCPLTPSIPVLNLVMKREYAEDILKGKKNVEFRAYSKHYYDRMYDKRMVDFLKRHQDDEEVMEAVNVYISSLRTVETIHFHNYNNTWHLDVEVTFNGVMSMTREDVDFLREEFGCTECDEELEMLERSGETNRPLLFYYVIGEVLDTNLYK